MLSMSCKAGFSEKRRLFGTDKSQCIRFIRYKNYFFRWFLLSSKRRIFHFDIRKLSDNSNGFIRTPQAQFESDGKDYERRAGDSDHALRRSDGKKDRSAICSIQSILKTYLNTIFKGGLLRFRSGTFQHFGSSLYAGESLSAVRTFSQVEFQTRPFPLRKVTVFDCD